MSTMTLSVSSSVIRKLKTRVYMNVKFRRLHPVAIPFTFQLSVSFCLELISSVIPLDIN